jgi:hypothetical protein
MKNINLRPLLRINLISIHQTTRIQIQLRVRICSFNVILTGCPLRLFQDILTTITTPKHGLRQVRHIIL